MGLGWGGVWGGVRMLLPNFIKGGSKGKGLRSARVRVCLQVKEVVVEAGSETCLYQTASYESSYWLLGLEVQLRHSQTSPFLPHREGVRLVKCLSVPLWTSSTHIDDPRGETVLTK